MPLGVNDYDTARIQDRNFADANSFNIVSPGLVTSGLVVNIDPGNLVSYPGTGTTLFNLSGDTINGQLINGPTFSNDGGGSFVFDGSNDRGTFNLPVVARTAQTYEVWVKGTAGPTASGGFGYILHIGGPGTITLIGAYAAILYAGSTLQTNEIAGSFDANAWTTMGTGVIGNSTTVRQIVLTWDLSIQRIYVDGTQRNSQTLTLTPGNFTSSVGFGDNNATAVYRPIVGNIYTIRAYNRALTPQEVQQNFNATRQRFGI